MSKNEQHHQDPAIRDDGKSMHELCKHHMFYHVIIKTNEGNQIEGIITDLDNKNVYMLVPQDMMPVEESPTNTGEDQEQRQNEHRQFYGPRYRRFYRQIFPLATLAALSLFPYYPPYSYPYPYPYAYAYPYYPYPYPYPYY